MLIRCSASPRAAGLALRLLRAQSNRLDTDFSSAVRLIASPSSVAIETTRMLRARRARRSVGSIESVITSSRSFEAVMRATAPPDRTPWVM